MKYFLFIAVLFFTTPSFADDVFLKPHVQTPQASNSQTAFAEAYFQNCMAQKADILSPDSQELLCACSAANMQQGKITVAEIALMREDTPAGQQARNKMLTDIYAPCIEYPAHDLILSRCISDAKVGAATGNTNKICGCVAGKVSRHLAANAQDIIRTELAKNPNNIDPLGIFLGSAAYEQQSRQAALDCIM